MIKATSLQGEEKEAIEAYIDSHLVSEVRSMSNEYSIVVVRIMEVDTIVVFVPEGVDLFLSAAEVRGVPIISGVGTVRTYGQEFATESVKARLETPTTGASIGVDGSDYAGTLGLYVKDKNGWLCALTCYHVVSPLDCTGRTIVTPHRSDSEEVIKGITQTIEQLNEVKAQREMIGDMSRARYSALRVQQLEFELDWALRDRYLGQASQTDFVLEESGEYVDAALIPVENFQLLHRSSDLNDPDIISGSQLVDQVRRPETLTAAEELQKIGRTSGHTSGRINPIQIRGSMKTRRGYACGFLAWGVVSDRRDGKFTLEGDSGSIVYHERELVGMVFGGVNGIVNGYSCDVTVFTTMSTLQDRLGFQFVQNHEWAGMYSATSS